MTLHVTPKGARSIPNSVRREVLNPKGYGASCIYCSNEADVIDHIMPVSRGGSSAISNLAPACWSCNAEKSDLTLDEWHEWRLMRGLSWPVNIATDLHPHCVVALDEEAERRGVSRDQACLDMHDETEEQRAESTKRMSSRAWELHKAQKRLRT